ncbi:zinc ABC transporter substrate-binding protein [candidate division WS5 bacterium]|uniref:Zinc ABC transporter substrate-binding protein n=1 Tax=candidate division WS5 bacterium TaxID=2093353 RepID=A0A419DFQ3_9BACT|nr:MAG: zinc ABC transporter substrate-binding protein [candidate division WS5 bacterium]
MVYSVIATNLRLKIKCRWFLVRILIYMNKKYLLGFVLGVVVIGLLTLAIKNNNGAPVVSSSKPQAVASFYPLYFFASQIAGDKADVSNITPAGAEPHDYEPTPQQIARIADSNLLVLNGGGLEAWADNVTENSDPKKTTIVIAGEGLMTQEVVEEGEKIADPHVWLSPVLAVQMVNKIETGLIKADPDNASHYQSNAQILKSKLENLNTEFEQGLVTCKDKNIITSHAAFGYLASTYDLNQVPITGVSPDAEPSPQELAQVAKFARDNHVKYIFFESLVSPKLSQTIATEVGAQTLVLNPLEGLTGEEIASGKDYFSEMRNNLANLKTALQCTP